MRGKRNNDFTLNTDLAPSILSAAQIPVPKQMQGKNIATLYLSRNEFPKWRQEFYYEWFTGNKQDIPASLALIRKDSKYIYWPDYDYEQLFRLDDDPFEERDVLHSQLKTDKRLLDEMKLRMAELKSRAVTGAAL